MLKEGGEKLAILDEVRALLARAEATKNARRHEDMESSWRAKATEAYGIFG
jgi:hypothetical protein